MPSLQIEQATVMGLPALIPVVQPVEVLTKNVIETLLSLVFPPGIVPTDFGSVLQSQTIKGPPVPWAPTKGQHVAPRLQAVVTSN